jgi:beta-xylosidase
MKYIKSLVLLFCFGCVIQPQLLAISPSFKTFMNPVIPGDHSDCTLTQIGNDFYTTGSSFNPTPVIYHSTDLIHWEAVAQPVTAAWSLYADSPSAGCWGGQVVFYDNKYWDFFSRANTMYFVTADKVEGPWTLPIKVENPTQLSYGLGYDNSIFVDEDGKWYMIVKNGQPNNGIVELGKDGQPTGIVYDLNWLNPQSENHPYSWAEGPVMWKHNGYYYYGFARDVSGGQKVMRSKTLTAEKSAWTVPVNLFNENNPAASNAIFSKPNHSSYVVTIKDGTSWLIHPVWSRANDGEWNGQGRQGLVNEVHYTEDGSVIADYPVNEIKRAPELPSSGIPWMVPKSDFFNSTKLNPEWSFLGRTETSTYSLTDRVGWLRLHPKNATKANTVIKTDAEHNYSLITKVDFTPTKTLDQAGFRIINGKENLMAKICTTIDSLGSKKIVFSFDNISYSVDNKVGSTIWLKIVRVDHHLTGYYSSNGEQWKSVGKAIDVSKLDSYSADYNGWCGNRQGLYVQGSTYADFALYIYRDAFTTIPATSPANQFGTKASTASGVKYLDDIHNGDWALYAGVEFGNDEYKKQVKSVELNIFNSTDIIGGIVEIWIDSIETGNKIACVKVDKQSSKSGLKKVVAKVEKVAGRHDVYLRFIGSKTTKLFGLASFKFN